MKNEPARRRLARIRCLLDTINRMGEGKSLPLPLCFVAAEVEFAMVDGSEALAVHKKPSKDAEKIAEIYPTAKSSVFASGDEFVNNQGAWLRLTQKSIQKFCTGKNVKEGWVMVVPHDAKHGVGTVRLTPVCKMPNSPTKGKQRAELVAENSIQSWQDSVEAWYSLRLTDPPAGEVSADKEAVKQLATPPPKWSLEADEQLARFLADHINKQETNLGHVSRYVDSIDVSSEEDTKDALTDGDPDTYWESDGSQSRHWIRLYMSSGTVIRQLSIGVDARDDNYMPSHVVLNGGHMGNLRQLNDTSIDLNKTGDVVILQDMTQFYPVIEIKIKECKDDGIDTRIHGIKIVSVKEKEPGLSRDVFAAADMIRYPKLDSVDPMLLYRRSQALLRFIELLDSVLHFLLPSWNYTAGSFKDLEAIRQLLPLSRHRNTLIDKLLKESQTCGAPSRMPKLYINRRLAAEHTADPSLDPDAKHSIFHQLYEGLREEKCGVKLDFRWSTRYDQWWECKFLSEGIIDQGGGFRDSLADMAEELCPSSSDSAMPLPFFVRSPNQLHDTSNVNRDAYVPNRSCKKFGKFEWMGMLMGGCLRNGREHLVLAFPSFVWKQLVGERVTWCRDFKSVDLAQVKLLESLESMDKETFEMKFGGVLTYTTVLNDSSIAELVPEGADKLVDYEDRLRYAQLVKEARMNDSKQQIDALKRGLLKVLPQAVLDLLTWQELERRVCGDPELSVEALKKCTHYEDITENDRRVKFLWRALENFSNEDRSRFLRFVSGRRRLPAPLYLCPGRSNAQDDSLPEAATCSSTLFLPEYSSAKVAEERIRYAAYNCVAIDTDLSPWEE